MSMAIFLSSRATVCQGRQTVSPHTQLGWFGDSPETEGSGKDQRLEKRAMIKSSQTWTETVQGHVGSSGGLGTHQVLTVNLAGM